MTKEIGIRPYGPGKFNTIVDSYVYGVSLDEGCDDERSHEFGGGWAGVVRSRFTIFRDHDPMRGTLTKDEMQLITGSAGVIITEDSQGFVWVEYYETVKELEAAWSKVCAEFDTDTETE